MSFTHTGVDYVAGLPGSHFPEKVFMYWNPDDPADTTSFYSIGGDFIRVAGWKGGDITDEWDQDVFLHEYGHFVMDNYAAFPPEIPGCWPEHHWQIPSSDRCAYTEGWATFYSCACQNDQVYLDTNSDGTTYLRMDVELPQDDPQDTDVEGAVCASLWDVFDYHNDGTIWGGDRWCHNNDQNAGLWWQEIDEIWYTFGETAYLGHFPYTVCEFNMTWAWKGYPTSQIWQNIFNAHGIECTPVGVEEELASMSNARPFLWPNHPNPFNPLTRIAFRTAGYARASLRVYDTGGQVIKTLLDSYKDPGTYTICWDGKDDAGRFLPSGVYFCQLLVGTLRQTRKLVVLR
jgi:hypothetical protein